MVCPCNKSLKLLYSKFGLFLLSELHFESSNEFSEHSHRIVLMKVFTFFLKALSCHPLSFLLFCLPEFLLFMSKQQRTLFL